MSKTSQVREWGRLAEIMMKSAENGHFDGGGQRRKGAVDRRYFEVSGG